MSNVIFSEEFFKKLRQIIENMQDFIKSNWFWGVIFSLCVAILIILQQILLGFLQGAF